MKNIKRSFPNYFFCLSCVHFQGETILSDFRIYVLVTKKRTKFYSMCAYRRSLRITIIVEYKLSKLKCSLSAAPSPKLCIRVFT